jgi:hypothetical protein
VLTEGKTVLQPASPLTAAPTARLRKFALILSTVSLLLGLHCTLPSEVDLPIAIDCCAVQGFDCQQILCETIATPINPFIISTGETLSCLELQATQD